jgi:hypothetical protein
MNRRFATRILEIAQSASEIGFYREAPPAADQD